MGELKTDTRMVIIGESRQDDGNIIFDVIATGGLIRGQGIGSDLPLDELLAELQKIPGVTATYEEPREPTVPERLGELEVGAVFALTYHFPRYVKVGIDKYVTEDGTGEIYHASHFASWTDFQLLNRGLNE